MATDLYGLVDYLNTYLKVDQIKDYCPNGLQVEGSQMVAKIIGGVTASHDLIDVAIKRKADAILVHHGYFWKGENQCVTGIKQKRLKSLLENDISLLAYHLPLDVHEKVGNNVQLAQLLDFDITGPLDPKGKPSVGLVGSLQSIVSADAFKSHLDDRLNRNSLHIPSDKDIKTVAWCTGAAQGMIELAVERGVDAYISGEISEPTVHIAKEAGIHYFSAGHHATERYGVQALGHHLKEKFDVEFEFVDLDNPV